VRLNQRGFRENFQIRRVNFIFNE